MAGYSDSRSFVQRFILLTFLAVLQVTGKEICDPSKCPGPLRYYKDLGCKPVYNQFGDCCPESYDCEHLKNLSRDKCYLNGHEYKHLEQLRDEDRNRCDVACGCSVLPPNDPRFTCAIVDCFWGDMEPHCFMRRSPDQCCGNIVCLKEGEIIATCEVDGITYSDGQYFRPKSDPDLDCFCQPGYKGENVEPFCKKPNRSYCSPFFNNISVVHNKCAPVYTDGQNLQMDCPYNNQYRCEEEDDVIIRNNSSQSEGGKMCKIGNLEMHKGDVLSPGKMRSEHVKCTCEIPPIPTCKIIADLSCRNTKQSVGAIYTRTNFVTLKYVTDSWGTITNGFRLVITAVKDPKHACKDFRCTQNEFCIETDLLCDGVNHCGDGSDEATSICANSETSTILGMQKIWFAVALVFLTLSVAGLVTAAVLCFCRRATTPRHPHNAHNAQSHPPVSFPLQQMYGSNGASAGLPVGMTTLKFSTGPLGPLANYGSGQGPGVTGATTLPRPGNWLRPAGLRHGHSAARVRLYCQAK